MHGSFFLTHFLDQTLGGIETSAFRSIVGLSASDAAEKATGVNGALSLELLVVGGMIAFFLFVRMTLSVERPNPAQQVAEMVGEFTGGLGEQIIGHGYEKYQAFLTCIFLFVLLNNLIGLIPGVPPPTVSPWVPLGLALPTFIYYNYQGFRAQGFIGYLKHFAGPLWWMAWLLLPIELVSHFARIMSLTIRLYANMYASDMVTLGLYP
jgi:F-type H+-transporting ATPase subunit a